MVRLPLDNVPGPPLSAINALFCSSVLSGLGTISKAIGSVYSVPTEIE